MIDYRLSSIGSIRHNSGTHENFFALSTRHNARHRLATAIPRISPSMIRHHHLLRVLRAPVQGKRVKWIFQGQEDERAVLDSRSKSRIKPFRLSAVIVGASYRRERGDETMAKR